MSLGPFDLTGGPFLTLYACLFLLALAASLIIPHRLRPEGQRQRVTDLDQLAWLAGGTARYSDMVVSRMLASRALLLTGPDRFGAGAAEMVTSPAERSVFALAEPVAWRDIAEALRRHAGPVERRLEQAGLLMTRAERGRIRRWAILPWLLLFIFGAIKWGIGDMRGKPLGFLTIFLIVTLLFAAIRFFTIDRRTKAGREALDHALGGKGRLKRAPTTPEIGLAVALFGTAVLAGSSYAEYHRLRTGGGGDGGSSGGGGDSGDGGSGCGGSGCGGCGGGGD